MADESTFSRVNRTLLSTRVFLGNLVFIVILVFLGGVLIGSCQSLDVSGKPALLLRPSGVLVEQRSIGNPLDELLSGAGQRHEVVLDDLTRSIDRATTDERIPVLVLDLGELEGLSPVQAEVIEKHLAAFQAAGKEVIAWGDWMSQASYRLASAADALYLHPMGGLLFEGFASHSLYFKELLDKLKVTIHVFRVGEFKSAIEPFTANGMSDSARTANRELVGGLWSDYVEAVTRNRKLEPGQFENFVREIDQRIETAGGDIARAALEGHLVDELLTADEFNARLVDRVGADAAGDFNAIHFADYLLATGGPDLPPPEASIGLIRMTGTILDSEDGSRSITPEVARDQIRRAREDRNIRAVVVRIDSPGGSAFASELIRRELELLQLAKKPVVVSMGDVAASGGYWIAATADAIFAHPQTITGSIGVFSILPTVEDALASIGVHSDGVGTGPLSPALNPFGPLPEPYARIAQASVNRTYTDFVHLVARGRDLEVADVQRIAEGRVWLGSRARELGLVTELGDLDAAVAHAAKLADVTSPSVREIKPDVDPRYQMLHALLDSETARFWLPPHGKLRQAVDELAADLSPLLNRPGVTLAYCGVCTTMLR